MSYILQLSAYVEFSEGQPFIPPGSVTDMVLYSMDHAQVNVS